MDKSKEIEISDSELKVIKILWDSSPLTAKEIVALLEPTTQWSDKTIKTLIFRLVKKRALDFRDDRREYQYFPLVEKEKYLAKESRNFMERLFDGATAPMIAHFVKSQKMSSKEIKEVQKILDEISQQVDV